MNPLETLFRLLYPPLPKPPPLDAVPDEGEAPPAAAGGAEEAERRRETEQGVDRMVIDRVIDFNRDQVKRRRALEERLRVLSRKVD